MGVKRERGMRKKRRRTHGGTRVGIKGKRKEEKGGDEGEEGKLGYRSEE